MKLKLFTAITLGILCAQTHADTTTQDMQGQPAQTVTSPAMPQDTTDAAKQKGAAFLKMNKTKPGVVTLPDGLQYKVIKAGTGSKPSETDIVTVEYAGTLIDGTEFDNSAKHGGTIDFPVGQVIPGWVEALKLMPVGSTWELYIPSELAYGDQGSPPAIGPNETLIFKVKLVAAKKAG